jgi:hypothetical protein
VAGSSGEAGSLSAIRSNFGAAVAGQRAGLATAQGLSGVSGRISAANQGIASSLRSARTFQAFTNLALGSIDKYENYRDNPTG